MKKNKQNTKAEESGNRLNFYTYKMPKSRTQNIVWVVMKEAFLLILINNPDAEHRGCCSHKVVAVGFNTLCYDVERRGIKPSARIKKII